MFLTCEAEDLKPGAPAPSNEKFALGARNPDGVTLAY